MGPQIDIKIPFSRGSRQKWFFFEKKIPFFRQRVKKCWKKGSILTFQKPLFSRFFTFFGNFFSKWKKRKKRVFSRFFWKNETLCHFISTVIQMNSSLCNKMFIFCWKKWKKVHFFSKNEKSEKVSVNFFHFFRILFFWGHEKTCFFVFFDILFAPIFLCVRKKKKRHFLTLFFWGRKPKVKKLNTFFWEMKKTCFFVFLEKKWKFFVNFGNFRVFLVIF